jgi:hypothetical protein
MEFSTKYFGLTVLLFIVEVAIGFFFHDIIVRPFVGDLLVVILIYCFVKTFINTAVKTTAIAVLLFAYVVEVSQYFHLIRVIGLEYSKAARLIMGTSFSWMDMLMYTLGIILVVILENRFASSIKLRAER